VRARRTWWLLGLGALAVVASAGVLVAGAREDVLCDDPGGAASFRAAIADLAVGESVALTDAAPARWDALWVFAEHESIASMERATGADLGGEPSSLDPWARSCAVTTVVLVRGGEAVAVYSYAAGEAPPGLRAGPEPYRADAYALRLGVDTVVCDGRGCPEVPTQGNLVEPLPSPGTGGT
jgi:hypothetical protein